VRLLPRVCRSLRQKKDNSECGHSECSRDSSSCEPFQRTAVKLVERIDCVGKNATAVACDHPRSRWNWKCGGVRRSRGFHRELESKGDDRGCGPRVMRDKKSIYIYTCLHVTLAIVRPWRSVQSECCGARPPICTEEKRSSEPPGILISPGACLWVELA
jgi:hypothetical protein